MATTSSMRKLVAIIRIRSPVCGVILCCVGHGVAEQEAIIMSQVSKSQALHGHAISATEADCWL